ncbi:hypothetical protein BWI97_20885 [Siphonobacter sp. BAB-5405]|uniref:hypothetical protein n=1 Tax=Siphonobacter sp. BAB-5405 TaxID=1864825 RepID=UPI000C801120|nr:hypothetical protein [Siphonobacter sp. BAB-5405]PMD92539.1 hypothetical protein BWI97_20885 [Siphonobacter sp. BAB-5405]
MKKVLSLVLMIQGAFAAYGQSVQVQKSMTIDSLGAGQGVSYIDGNVYLYGDREVGIIREYILKDHELQYTQKEVQLSIDSKDIINHPTGIAHKPGKPVFIGNSIRLNPEGTQWKAVIYQVNWAGLLQSGTLQGNLIRTIEDDACIQGTRPEYVQYEGRWYVATADYGNKANEVRLYDPQALTKAIKTSDPGVLYKKFICSPWVQNLHFIPDKNILVLIQNQIEGRRWRLTFLDLNQSIAQSKEHVLKVIDFDKTDELEGFTLTRNGEGILVTSSKQENVHWVAFDY